MVQGGEVSFFLGDEKKTVRLVRAHLEEDAGKVAARDFIGQSGIDLNRAGTPLLEIVTEPDIRSSEEAVAYARELHKIVTWIGICDGNMQEGSFRCGDAKRLVRKPGAPLGTRREIKNLNSFKFMQQAIDYEIRWQIEQIEDGHAIQQATVLFDPDTGETRAMRTKEDAADYRYFPDPDLPPLRISEQWVQESARACPNCRAPWRHASWPTTACPNTTPPRSRNRRPWRPTSRSRQGERQPQAGQQLDHGRGVAPLERGRDRHRRRAGHGRAAGEADRAHRRRHHLQRRRPAGVRGALERRGPGRGRRDRAKGLKQMNDSGALEKIIDEVIAANPDNVAQFKAGKDKAFNALVGQAMKASRGKANPQQVNDMLRAKLAAA